MFYRYIRAITRFRQEERIVYLDKTWVNQGHTRQRQWQTATGHRKIQGVAPAGKGQRLIHVDAGGQEGFVEGVSLTFLSKSASDDYNSEMNGEV